METGFLSAVHDEEHFSSCFYSQGQGLDDSEGSLFGGMIVPDLDYDSGRFDPLPLWDSVGDIPGIIIPEKHMPSSPQCKEDFHKMFKDWQEHLTYMQVPESLKADDTLNISTRLTGDIFTPASNSLPTPSIDELFPLEIKQEETSLPEDETDRMQIEPVFSSGDKQVRNSEEEAEELARHVKKEIKLEIEEDCFDVEIDGEESIVKEEEIKLETEDDCVDIETVGDQMPVLEAGDLKSLLEQFEASEAVNGLDENKKKSILDAHLYNMVNQPASVPLSPPPASSVPTNQIIRDSLPKEVIDRIKASGRKKTISLIPAIPNKKSVRSATRMQDAAAALSRNKLLKLVTGGSSGESVQLDHDYCTSSDSMCTSVASSVYHSDNTDYPNTPEPTYSRLPDYYVALAPQKALEPRLNNDKWVEKNSKKDSGLESGDVSDASEETQTTPTEIKQKVVLKSVQGVKSVQVVTESGVVIGSAAVKQERKEMPMVSVLKKCNNISNNSNSGSNSVINSVSMSVESNVVSVSAVTSSVTSVILPSVTTVSSSTSICNSTSPPTMDVEKPAAEEPIKKKKLNLEEYRVRREERERIRSQENSRANSPVSCLTPTQPDSTSQVEGIKTEKPAMQSVEVQTVDFPEEELKKKDLKSRKERDQSKERRNDVRHRRYRARHVSSSSSSSSGGSSHHRSRRQRKHSRTGRSKSNNPASRMWSRSRSRSSSHASNCSSCSSNSRSRSRSRDSHWNGKWRSRSPRRTGRYNKHHHWRDNRRWQRRSPVRLNRPLPVVNQEWGVAEKMRQVEERRVIYVGRIEEGTTKAHLRERFQVFGPIVDISVHFRERGDNYGFVTFAYKVDAYEAVEHGNDDPSLPHYDLCFGGRRAFCKQRYADLDGVNSQQYNPYQGQRSNESFDLLLREAQAKLRKRSSV